MLKPEVLITVAGCIVVALIAIAAYTKRANLRRRVAAIKERANQMGLQVIDDADGHVYRQFQNFKLFADGAKRQITNLIVVDSENVRVLLFDYRYVTNPTGKGTTTHDQTVVATQSKQLDCPEILMRPETFADKIDSALGFRPRGYDLDPEFSKVFILNGPDEAAIRSFFTPEVLKFFEQHPHDSVEAWEDTLFFYRPRKLCTPDELEGLLAKAREAVGVLSKANC